MNWDKAAYLDAATRLIERTLFPEGPWMFLAVVTMAAAFVVWWIGAKSAPRFRSRRHRPPPPGMI